jgi:hypothetical protein
MGKEKAGKEIYVSLPGKLSGVHQNPVLKNVYPEFPGNSRGYANCPDRRLKNGLKKV